MRSSKTSRCLGGRASRRWLTFSQSSAATSQSALSQHLGKLRADGLVTFRRTSQTLHYRVADKRTLRVLQVLKEIYCGNLK